MNYDKEKYKIWTWKSSAVLFWFINPLGFIYELILGQAMPKVMLIEREGEKTLYQRVLIPCPHCGELHSGMKYSFPNKTVFKNWFGLYCDNCKEIIPVQRNLFSLIILTLTFPIWGWFRESLKQNWLSKQAKRYKNLNLEINDRRMSTRGYWLKLGLLIGLLMYVIMVFVLPYIEQEHISQKRMLLELPLWLICGLSWGLSMKWWMNKKGKVNKALVDE